jgi:uncharacterized protein YjiS (DUF1127 family)
MNSQVPVSHAQIEAGIARARQLRSEYLTQLAQTMTKALIRRFRRREAARALDDLPDYLLDDVGIARAEILAVADGTLKRRPSALARAVRRGLAALDFTQRAVDPANEEHRKMAA